jgi:hypothetical protein
MGGVPLVFILEGATTLSIMTFSIIKIATFSLTTLSTMQSIAMLNVVMLIVMAPCLRWLVGVA